MDIDQIIKETFQQLLAEFEVRKSSFLNIIHHNIDIMVKNAQNWFGEDVPQEFTDVLNSLINLTIIYFEQNRDFVRFSEQEYEVFDPRTVFNEIREDMLFLLNKDVTVIGHDDIYVNSSRKIFKDSCLNMFLCISQFAQPESDFTVKIENVMSSVKCEMTFSSLSSEMPELSKLLKVFYSYYAVEKYHFRIGLDIPFSNIKKIGGIVHAQSKIGTNSIVVTVSLPSHKFLQTVDDIRRNNIDSKTIRYTGEVLVSVRESVLEMVLRENLVEAGYSIKVIAPEKIKFEVSGGKALILDTSVYTEIRDSLIGSDHGFSTILVIGTSRHAGAHEPFVTIVPMPFEVQDLVEIIERKK
jgi:hypothetical protein